MTPRTRLLAIVLALVACQREEPRAGGVVTTENDNGRVTIAAEARIEAPIAEVWQRVIDIPNRRSWSPWMASADPIGRSAEVALGMKYRATLALDRHQVPAELEVTAFDDKSRFAWNIVPTGESQLSSILETVTLAPDGERVTKVTYELRYEVPDRARGAERMVLREPMERLVKTTVELLKQKILEGVP